MVRSDFMVRGGRLPLGAVQSVMSLQKQLQATYQQSEVGSNVGPDGWP